MRSGSIIPRILDIVLICSEWSTSDPGGFTLKKRILGILKRRTDWPHSWSRQCGVEKHVLAMLYFKP
jgi:hypothetical protein